MLNSQTVAPVLAKLDTIEKRVDQVAQLTRWLIAALIASTVAVITAITIQGPTQASAGIAAPDGFNYLPGILFTVISLGTIFGIMYMEDRDARIRRHQWQREVEEALGGPFVSPWD